jgi:endonuclease/exonuclease/phosphatase (EEP) superfamily protein YafD
MRLELISKMTIRNKSVSRIDPRAFLRIGLVVLIFSHTALIIAYYAINFTLGERVWIFDALGYIHAWLFLPSLLLLPIALLRRSPLLIFLAVIPPIIFVMSYGRFFLPHNNIENGGHRLTVMTYNVHDANKQIEAVADQIDLYNPDIIGLHELEANMAQALEARLATTYPYRLFAPSRGIFSRYPFESAVAYQLGKDGYWMQQVVVSVAGHQVNLLNVHIRSPRLEYTYPLTGRLGIPTGFATENRNRDMADLLAILGKLDGIVVILGDLNLTDRHDLYKELTHTLIDTHMEEGRGLGFTRGHFPQSGLATWRIDFVLHSTNLVTLASDTGVFAGSDHRPVISVLGFPLDSR